MKDSRVPQSGRGIGSRGLSPPLMSVALRLSRSSWAYRWGEKNQDRFLAIVFLFGVFFIRSAQLQAFQERAFSLLADRNKNKTVLVTAHRGILYDRHLTPLAWNVPSFAVTVTPADLPKDPEQKKQALSHLASLLGTTTGSIEKSLAGKNLFQPSIVKERIGYDASLGLSVALEGVPAVNLVVEERREYGFSSSTPSLSHVLGYTGRISEEELVAKGVAYHLNDVIGKEGVELVRGVNPWDDRRAYGRG